MAWVCRDSRGEISPLLLISYAIVVLLPPSVMEKHRSEEMEVSDQGWWYTNYLPFFRGADSMHPVCQLGRDNRSILHMSVFL